ncbi:STAS domain-containing protein [Streptomyces sp. Ag109_O5-10]|uniref:STAS domain-containing protein n=1 Tax=Streptomyces sp. Ag109_O5-10 TaxID=1855349 RepID=UPI00089903E6|nr:STAS domain-containing protein [Streptomyces sp. Ag109_O5-10]SEE40191.1 stage II sporulation protein AA (anti-sigma F factor antagonist) [Streptomyces sp. Ag109_O5-10]
MTDNDNWHLSIACRRTGGVRVITACGEIDLDSAPQLLDALTADGAAAPVTVVDLSGVTFMDSSGINALIAAHHAAQHHGGQLRLAAPSPSVSEIFGIVGLTEVVPCHPTLRDALDACPRQSGGPDVADARHNRGGHQNGTS